MLDLSTLEEKINIYFNNKLLLQQALTHSSYRTKKIRNNERLEFFGDAILKLSASEYLYHKYDSKSEGELTKLRSHLISDKTLSLIAEWYNLKDYFYASHSILQSNKIQILLGNAVEALIAAIFIDQGLDKAKQFLTPIFIKCEQLIGHLLPEDYKTNLQELLQKNKLSVPNYHIIKTLGPDHQKLFFVRAIDEDE